MKFPITPTSFTMVGNKKEKTDVRANEKKLGIIASLPFQLLTFCQGKKATKKKTSLSKVFKRISLKKKKALERKPILISNLMWTKRGIVNPMSKSFI